MGANPDQGRPPDRIVENGVLYMADQKLQGFWTLAR